VVHAYNPSYSGGRDQGTMVCSLPRQIVLETLSQKNLSHGITYNSKIKLVRTTHNKMDTKNHNDLEIATEIGYVFYDSIYMKFAKGKLRDLLLEVNMSELLEGQYAISLSDN
jgi:hypothetical protein